MLTRRFMRNPVSTKRRDWEAELAAMVAEYGTHRVMKWAEAGLRRWKRAEERAATAKRRREATAKIAGLGVAEALRRLR